MYTNPYSNEVDEWHPFALKVQAESEDHPTLKKILNMSSEEQKKWFAAMDKEINALFNKETFKEIPRSQMQEENTQKDVQLHQLKNLSEFLSRNEDQMVRYQSTKPDWYSEVIYKNTLTELMKMPPSLQWHNSQRFECSLRSLWHEDSKLAALTSTMQLFNLIYLSHFICLCRKALKVKIIMFSRW